MLGRQCPEPRLYLQINHFFWLSACLLSFYVSMNVVCVNDIGRGDFLSGKLRSNLSFTDFFLLKD